jgi:hypothetical protein
LSAKNLLINSHQAYQIAAHLVHHLPVGLPDDNPSTFGDHYGFGCHAGAGLKGLASCCWQEDLLICSFLFLSNFSAINLLINSHQAHQTAAHPVHHLSMGLPLPADNPGSFGDHYGFGCHAGRGSSPKSTKFLNCTYVQKNWPELLNALVRVLKKLLLHALLAAESGVDDLSYCRSNTLCICNYSVTFTVLIFFLRKT